MVLQLDKQIFRLRKCPIDIVDGKALAALLGSTLEGISPKDVHVQSLATEYNVREPMKTATLWFESLPNLVKDSPQDTQWSIPLEPTAEWDGSARQRLLLDTHFSGFTPLHDVAPEKYEFESSCVVISGLSSHPFGSWKPKGSDKYMWIRDTLPEWLPHVRPILYGYDSTLTGSTSFQSISDIASGLIEHLSPPGWSTAEMKPLVFLAHSLGGIVLKQALLILADRSIRGAAVLNFVRGGILFGVPNRGMTQGPLLAMVKGQPNESLVRDLAEDSDYLKNLDDLFTGILIPRQIIFNFAYETKTSPTVVQLENGSFSRTGPRQILVDPPSATRGLHGSSQEIIFGIDQDHSNMVKFPDGSSVCENILKRLERLCPPRDSPAGHHASTTTGVEKPRSIPPPERTNTQRSDRRRANVRNWTLKDVEAAFPLPHVHTDGRYRGVETHSPHTFEWAVNRSSQLAAWIKQDVSGLFWINGKPGSGKSTLMKFIEDHKQTHSLLTELSLSTSSSTDCRLIRAHHFLHMRGTLDQSSFLGLLQNILHQILDSFPKLVRHVFPVLENTSRIGVSGGKTIQNPWTDQDLLQCLRLILNQSEDDIVVFLLFDALDEFGGDTGFISKFLHQHLLGMAGPRTRVKILFSSRPWDVFLVEFKGIPFLKLQDHNEADIIQYCYGRIQVADNQPQSPLQDLVPEIAVKAEGVFIWVRLMMNDLLNHAQTSDSLGLRNILRSTPSDLNDFYASIIQRLNHKDRLDAYVIFQMALATQEPGSSYVNVLTLIYILAIHSCRTYEASKERFDVVDKQLFPGRDKLRAKFSRSIVDTKLKTHRVLGHAMWYGSVVPRVFWPTRDSKWDPALRPRDMARRTRSDRGKTALPLNSSAYWRYLELLRGNHLDFDVVQDHVRMINRCSGGLVEVTARNPAERHGRIAETHFYTSAYQGEARPYGMLGSLPEPGISHEGWRVEFLHQTVLDFVKRPIFNNLLLEEMAHSVRDNRYGYMAKLFFTNSPAQGMLPHQLSKDIGSLCLDAELSTGQGFSEFIDTVPLSRFKEIGVSGPTSFAIQADLVVYLEGHQFALQNSQDASLLELLVKQSLDLSSSSAYSDLSRRICTLRLMLQHALGTQRIAAFRLLLSTMYDVIWGSSLTSTEFANIAHRAAAMADLFLKTGQNPELDVHGIGRYSGRTISKHQISLKGTSRMWRATFYQHLTRDMWWRPIHPAPFSLTIVLLDCGANVNGEDIAGNTALDWLLADFDVPDGATSRGLLSADLRSRWKVAALRKKDRGRLKNISSPWEEYHSFHDSCRKIMILVRHGGITKTTGLKVWHTFFGWIRQQTDLAESEDPTAPSEDIYQDWQDNGYNEKRGWFLRALQYSGFDLVEVEGYVANLALPLDSTPAKYSEEVAG